MDKERLEKIKKREIVFLRMEETSKRPLTILEVNIKKILPEKPKSSKAREDTVSVRVQLPNSNRCLLVFSNQLFSDHESAKLGCEKEENS